MLSSFDDSNCRILNCSLSHSRRTLSYIVSFFAKLNSTPYACKKAIITPLLKESSVNSFGDLRPVSILCPVSKSFREGQQFVEYLRGNLMLIKVTDDLIRTKLFV